MNSYRSDTTTTEEVPEGSVAFRVAGQADLGALTKLTLELMRDMDVVAPDEESVSRTLTAPLGGRWSFSPEGEGRLILLAEKNGETAAICTLVFTLNPWVGALVCEIRDLVVTAAERRRGIGRRLLHAAFDEARTRGAALTYLLTEQTNLKAQAFYKRLGFAQKGCAYFEKTLR